MLALCAYWEGTVQETERFDDHVEKVHLPKVAEYPRLQALRYLKGIPRDGQAPRCYLAFELYFESEEDLAVALSSEVHHVLYQVEDIPIPR
jgi:uncharacterized protein (TIGR02118 family)